MEKKADKILSYEEIINQKPNGGFLKTSLEDVEDAEPISQPPVGMALQEAMSTARRLDEQIEKLNTLLHPIMRDREKSSNRDIVEKCTIESNTTSPLGKEINMITSVLSHSTDIINDILGSVEI